MIRQVNLDMDEYRGKSTDTKPSGVANGTTFLEIDTGAKYMYDEENGEWCLMPSNINAEASIRATQDASLRSQINAEASTRATQDASLQSQINQMIAPSGEAPSAAEVENARIGSDNTVYPTLGDAIRTQNSLLKSALQDTTGNLLIDGWVDGKFISTNGATYNPNGAVYNASFRYVFVNCTEGDIFTINGEGGGNPRLWAFADSANNILDRSAADATGSNLVITAPANAVRLILNDKAKTANSYGGILLKDTVKDVSEKADKNASDIVAINTRMVNADGGMYINPDDFELGNITMSSNGWVYNNTSQRVRTKESYGLELEVGDIVRVKDPTKVNIGIGYQTTSTTYGTDGWQTEYVAKYGGLHAILIKAIPEATQTSKDALLSQLEIIKYKNNKQNNKITAALINNPLLAINHRGFNRTAPENTIPAFRLSKGYGFTHIETDIAWTSDGVAVCLHDNTINRTARNADGTEISGTVNIADITYEQALTYDFGIWKAARYAGTRIPTFEEVLTLCKKQGIKVCAELKAYGYTNTRMTEAIDMVQRYDAESYVIWTSFDESILTYIKGLDSSATLELISTNVTSETITKVQSLKTDDNVVLLASEDYSSTALNLCKQAGIPLTVYTVNSIQTMEALPGYISGVTSDLYPVNVVWNEAV